MAWLDTVPELAHQSTQVNTALEDRSGTHVAGDLILNWAARLYTSETAKEYVADGISQAAAEAWQSALTDAQRRQRTYGTIDISVSGVALYLPIIAREVAITRSISRTNEAGAYRCTETTTITEVTGENLNA